ncbi:uncharacterized protein LOC115762843 [Drosophila novamexicana]|uniref:uncharacterized protein LOC115762843 n=1 Tax=Drosophila novamexicana TaxID=47314 RepID=UPI0011E5D9ED|nr:uncharacterized protein LOC115762843 [Drosophila novamexicana]
MRFELTVDRGPCDTELRSWCLGIAIYTLISIALNTLFAPSALTFIGFAIAVIANVCLLIGCLRYNHVLVGIWLIYALLIAINFPFAVFGTIFHFGGYREATGFNNVILALLFYIVVMLICLFCARIVYSYHLQLKNRQGSPPQHSVVV